MPFNIVPKAAASPAPNPQGAKVDSQAAIRAAVIAKIEAARNTAPPTTTVPISGAPEKQEEASETGQVAESSQNPTIETSAAPVVEAAAPAKPAEEPLSSQYAQLARKEKALRAQAMQAKAQNDALAAREAAIKAKEAELSGDAYIPKSRLSTDTMKALEEAGVSYEQITQMMLNAPSPEAQQQASVISKLEAKIAALEEGQKKVTTTFEESQKSAYTQAVNQLKADAKRAVFTNPEFETIKETNSVNDVVDLIVKTFESGLDDKRPKGTLLSVEEAAQMVEEHLAEEAFKLVNLSKVKKRLASQAVATATTTTSGKQAASPPGEKQPTTTMKTLTNRDGSARTLSSRERAILAFKGELNK